MLHSCGMAVIICKACQKKAKNFGRGVCQACYQKLFRVEYFQAYRSRPAYREQRIIYDIRYTLKHVDNNLQKKDEEILTF